MPSEAILDDEFAGEPQVSICEECAKHPSLKQLICEDAVIGLCCLCGRGEVKVRNPPNLEPMAMLIRALIRYYWDESDYNSHWGGDSPVSLFQSENPILMPFETDEFLDEFQYLLEEPVYPPEDQGVSIYAGHYQEMRLCYFAISKTYPNRFIQLQRRLLTENFFVVAPDLEQLLTPFINDIALVLPAEDEWFRARLGNNEVFQHIDGLIRRKVSYQPWMGDQIAAPPALLAGNGRLNRAGVSMLYLASNEKTALAEIRPRPGHSVSLGAFRNKVELRVADFNPDISLFSSSDVRLDYFAVIQAFDRLMSTPVTPKDKTSYLITQLLSEVLIKLGFDGVRYRSSVSKGVNICVFYPEKFSFTAGQSKVLRLDAIEYNSSYLETIITPGPDDFPLKGRE